MVERSFVRNPDAISSETPDNIVALDPGSGDCYAFSGPSARIWAMLETPVTATQIVDKLVAEFDITADACRSEVDAYLARLEAEGLAGPA